MRKIRASSQVSEVAIGSVSNHCCLLTEGPGTAGLRVSTSAAKVGFYVQVIPVFSIESAFSLTYSVSILDLSQSAYLTLLSRGCLWRSDLSVIPLFSGHMWFLQNRNHSLWVSHPPFLFLFLYPFYFQILFILITPRMQWFNFPKLLKLKTSGQKPVMLWSNLHSLTECRTGQVVLNLPC